jgi:hypothetical protein
LWPIKKQISDVEVSGNEVLVHEIPGVVEGAASDPPLDEVEHPAGRIRVLAGDKRFARSSIDKIFRGNNIFG